VTLAQGALLLDDLTHLIDILDVAAAFTLEGFRGQAYSWSERSDKLHPQKGQQLAGAHLRGLLDNSRLWNSREARYLQDPLSLRCVPQINGACYQTLEWTRDVWHTEINAVVDNPALDLNSGDVIPHGNMEISLLAVSLDAVRSAFAKAIEASGERLQKAQWPAFTGLPVGLANETGTTGGVQFLNLDHLAAAYVSACKVSATPVAQNYRGQPSDGVEDVGGMTPMAVSECERMADAAWSVAALEAIIGVWAINRRSLPRETIGSGLQGWFDAIRPLLPIGSEGERIFDIQPIVHLLRHNVVGSE
jgi:histidine ammonia-lyase